MMTHRVWRTGAAVLLAAVVASTGSTAAAASQDDGHQVRYCTKVDAYRIQTCARAILPATPVGGSCNVSWPSWSPVGGWSSRPRAATTSTWSSRNSY